MAGCQKKYSLAGRERARSFEQKVAARVPRVAISAASGNLNIEIKSKSSELKNEKTLFVSVLNMSALIMVGC